MTSPASAIGEFSLSTLKFIGRAISEIEAAFTNGDDHSMAIFTGIEEDLSSHEEVCFGAYFLVNNNAMWFPTLSSELDVIREVHTMVPGQSFKITGANEEIRSGHSLTVGEVRETGHDRALCMRINDIKIDDECVMYPDITEKTHSIIILEQNPL